ncbi:Questin oxidase [Erysiphe necator]|nr:Questin oxidase [Erysiphe necator]
MSAPMIAWEPIVNRLFRYITIGSDTSTSEISFELPPVQVHDVETAAAGKRLRTLKHLLRANHINHAIFYSNLIFHNHMPHLLGSAYILGADVEQLHNIYDKESKELAPWSPSPAEITSKEWRNFLSDKRYQRAYIDFFEDELALKFHYNWRDLVNEYLFHGEEPLINGITSGLGHPLIHLAYAFELSCKELAIEALAQASLEYDFMHKYFDDPSYTKPSTTFTSTSPLKILQKIHDDTRFDNIFTQPGPTNIEPLFSQRENQVLEYWNSWTIENPIEQFKDSQNDAITLLTQTVESGHNKFDFFLVHILTTSHAIRILLPLIPPRFHLNLVRQWWLLTIAVYIAQLRPVIRNNPVELPPNKDWNYVQDQAIRGTWSKDAHYVKAIRAIKETASTWGDIGDQLLAAAVRFADDFDGWTGFGVMRTHHDDVT